MHPKDVALLERLDRTYLRSLQGQLPEHQYLKAVGQQWVETIARAEHSFLHHLVTPLKDDQKELLCVNYSMQVRERDKCRRARGQLTLNRPQQQQPPVLLGTLQVLHFRSCAGAVGFGAVWRVARR